MSAEHVPTTAAQVASLLVTLAFEAGQGGDEQAMVELAQAERDLLALPIEAGVSVATMAATIAGFLAVLAKQGDVNEARRLISDVLLTVARCEPNIAQRKVGTT